MIRTERSNKRIVRVLRDMGEAFLHKHVARCAAALSYYVTLSLFPFLICVSAVLGSMHIQESYMFDLLYELAPFESFTAISEYLLHIAGNRSGLMLGVGITALLTSSSAAFRAFTGIMGELQGEMRFTGIWRGVFSFIFSFAFLFAIYVSGLVILSGEWLMQILRERLGFANLFSVMRWVRFVILFLLLFGIIFGVYIISAPKETKKTQRLPGALAASIVLVIASALYSQMITVSLRYELLYGSLPSFIIMMIWLYTCGIILIMGNMFNISLHKTKQEALTGQ